MERWSSGFDVLELVRQLGFNGDVCPSHFVLQWYAHKALEEEVIQLHERLTQQRPWEVWKGEIPVSWSRLPVAGCREPTRSASCGEATPIAGLEGT